MIDDVLRDAAPAMPNALPDLYATFAVESGFDEPSSVSVTLAHAQRNAAIFAENSGHPISIVRYTFADTERPVLPPGNKIHD